MTLNEIAAWIDERIMIPARHEYHDTPTSSKHRVMFENGDTYEQQSEDITLGSMTARYIINGKTVKKARFMFDVSGNFGWKEVETA